MIFLFYHLVFPSGGERCKTLKNAVNYNCPPRYSNIAPGDWWCKTGWIPPVTYCCPSNVH